MNASSFGKSAGSTESNNLKNPRSFNRPMFTLRVRILASISARESFPLAAATGFVPGEVLIGGKAAGSVGVDSVASPCAEGGAWTGRLRLPSQ